MKFRIKITLCMICILSILFGIGGSAFIMISFQGSLEREKQTAWKSFQFMLGALQVMDASNLWNGQQEVSDLLKKLAKQNGFSWSALRLSTDAEILYSHGKAEEQLKELFDQMDTKHYLITYFRDPEGIPYLQISNTFKVGQEIMYLDAALDISRIYESRDLQKTVYNRIYGAMLIVCTLLSYTAAWLLTRPLSKLSRASREIAEGNLSYRSNIQANDEIGSLARDFDAMAEQVEKSVSEIKEAVKRQEQFMGSFAHELKTPMTSVIGYADLLRGMTLSEEEQAEAANYIFSEGKRLERLSFKLLELFVADRNALQLTVASPADLVKNLIEELRPIYQKMSIQLVYTCEAGLCRLEPDLIQTLLMNLLENSCKALENGGMISIALHLLPDGFCLCVEDNGKGIPEEAMVHLTEAFYRVDKARSRNQGSAGLGLALCVKIAELHHGELRFDSKEGVGTKVTAEFRGGAV